MSKRKHSELEEDDPSGRDESREERKIDLRATRLRHKYERGSQLLYRALKTARGFERQKLGRRQKTARKDNDEKTLERLEREVQALKSLDLAVTAEKHLLKQLVKTKRIAESPEFARLRNSTSVSIAGPKDIAEANVTARLFKSNPVKNAMPGIMSGIRAVLGLDDVPTKKTGETGHKDKDVGRRDDAAKQQDRNADREENDAENDGSDVSMDDAEQQSVDFAQFDHRLASSSSEDSGSESESDSEMRSKPKSKQERYDAAADLSLSPSPSASRSASESPPPSKVKGRKKTGGADGKAKATTFLPSLMGGYWSGSESGGDVDDIEEIRPRRKNRMGQKARRALWEKKYGSKANHLQKQKQKEKESRDKGWDPRRGATEDDGDAKPKWGKKGAGQSQQQRAGSAKNDSAGPQQQRKKQSSEEKPLHPSWEAARKAKEQTAQASFQGKKIVFD
ncbi:hypothetical protein VTN77DRAFT_6658 [Rasamsonia byssochlamydoides]|uniref:uncharacterized protein n=1 Tax=Rasamsonia byssochlamydoides TaxID=89139 RepID=UPI003744632F